MGNISGTTPFHYTTNSGANIKFIFWDLKGRTRFPPEPSNEAEGTLASM